MPRAARVMYCKSFGRGVSWQGLAVHSHDMVRAHMQLFWNRGVDIFSR